MPEPTPTAARAALIWFVSRHPGALAWMQRHNLHFDRHATHLDIRDIVPGDTVIGSLPIHLAAALCAGGARYVHLSLDLPSTWRGRELQADDLDRFGARLEPFAIRKLP